MEEVIPKVVIDKITSITNQMRVYIERIEDAYKENPYSDIVRLLHKALIFYSKEVVDLFIKNDIKGIEVINSNLAGKDFVFNANFFCEKVEHLIFDNSLKLYDQSIVSDGQVIVFDNKWKDRIRTYVVTIKSILDNANMENERLRNSIFSKLNAFSAELDKTKTFVQSFQDAFLEMTLVAGQSAENIKPAVSLGLKVMRAFGHLIDIADHPQLPPPDDHKLLPPPNENEEDQ